MCLGFCILVSFDVSLELKTFFSVEIEDKNGQKDVAVTHQPRAQVDSTHQQQQPPRGAHGVLVRWPVLRGQRELEMQL